MKAEPGGSVLRPARGRAHGRGARPRRSTLPGGHLELVAAVRQLADESVPHEPVPVGPVIGEHRGAGTTNSRSPTGDDPRKASGLADVGRGYRNLR